MTENTDSGLEVRQDELIVDLRQRDAVAQVLAHDLGVWPATPAAADQEESRDLELALLRNLRLRDYAPRARRQYANEIAALKKPDRDFTDLDVLLYDLRIRFGIDRGWVPLIGKNRDAIVGFPQHKAFANPTVPTVRFTIAGDAGRGVRIGVVDGPLAHNDLLPADVVTRDEEFVGSTSTPAPVGAGHACFVAGLIRRAAPGAHLDVRTGLDAKTGLSTAWTAARKIASFQHADIDILNLSLGCVTADNEPPLVLRRALDRLDSRILVVAAAGNREELRTVTSSADPDQVWPGASTRVIAVGAATANGVRAEFSVSKDWVDCLAPGVDVISTYLTGPVALEGDKAGEEKFDGVAVWKGTSFAAATVSGAIAATMSGPEPLSAVEAFAVVLKKKIAGVVTRPVPHA